LEDLLNGITGLGYFLGGFLRLPMLLCSLRLLLWLWDYLQGLRRVGAAVVMFLGESEDSNNCGLDLVLDRFFLLLFRIFNPCLP
jgi:hypothetical protein